MNIDDYSQIKIAQVNYQTVTGINLRLSGYYSLAVFRIFLNAYFPTHLLILRCSFAHPASGSTINGILSSPLLGKERAGEV